MGDGGMVGMVGGGRSEDLIFHGLCIVMVNFNVPTTSSEDIEIDEESSAEHRQVADVDFYYNDDDKVLPEGCNLLGVDAASVQENGDVFAFINMYFVVIPSIMFLVAYVSNQLQVTTSGCDSSIYAIGKPFPPATANFYKTRYGLTTFDESSLKWYLGMW